MAATETGAATGLAGLARRLRSGELTSEQATQRYLDRIDVLDPRLGAFEHVARDAALDDARRVDALRADGVDLGPLMGVPIAVKDLFVVDGMPTTAGSRVPIDDLVGAEGTFVGALRAAGCVVLGKTKTVEFGLGITGVSAPRGTPRNPWDSDAHRIPGGSSSGSAVAVAAGLCAFAVGGDTGGSARVPAALCGVFGLKPTFGRWPCDGAFPLAPHLDTVGLLTRSAADAALVIDHLTGFRTEPATMPGLRVGVLDDYFFAGADAVVGRRVATAIAAVEAAGASLGAVELPSAPEREAYFPPVFAECLVDTLGAARYAAQRDRVDPVVAARIDGGLELRADREALEIRRRRSIAATRVAAAGWDCWLAPTAKRVAPTVSALAHPADATALALAMTETTQPVNYLDLCAASIPLPGQSSELPVGLQVICPGGADGRLLSIAVAVEALLGRPARPPLAALGPAEP